MNENFEIEKISVLKLKKDDILIIRIANVDKMPPKKRKEYINSGIERIKQIINHDNVIMCDKTVEFEKIIKE